MMHDDSSAIQLFVKCDRGLPRSGNAMTHLPFPWLTREERVRGYKNIVSMISHQPFKYLRYPVEEITKSWRSAGKIL